MDWIHISISVQAPIVANCAPFVRVRKCIVPGVKLELRECILISIFTLVAHETVCKVVLYAPINIFHLGEDSTVHVNRTTT